jgi:hypothetical protein
MPDEQAPLQQGTEASIPRLKLGQSSYNGLWTLGGSIFEECQHELRWPQAISTYKKMAKDATIAPALSLVEMSMARVPWTVKIPEGHEDALKDKAEFLRQCMNDMDHTWGSFIRQAVTFNRYGFAAHEKVYRKRFKRNGSKYDDGLVGLAALPIIAQDTISSWQWEEKGRKLKGLLQYIVEPSGKDQLIVNSSSKDEFIPRKKFILFRNNLLKDNPEGESPLKSCWAAWKYKTSLEEFEAMGVSSDLRGLKVLYIPPRYMAADASPEDAQVYAYYKEIMRNLHMNEQSGLILPQVLDDQGEQYFKFDVISISGQKAHDVDSIIQRYKNEIISSLMASQLILGQGGGGSFSLAESLQGISDMAIESKLIEIRDVLNHDFVNQIFQLNGWDTTVTPYFDFGEIKQVDLDVLSKYAQRVASVGLLPKTPEVVNYLTEQMGMTAQFEPDEDQEKFESLLTGNDSRAADGLTTAGEGTSTSPVGSDDASVGNTENS